MFLIKSKLKYALHHYLVFFKKLRIFFYSYGVGFHLLLFLLPFINDDLFNGSLADGLCR